MTAQYELVAVDRMHHEDGVIEAYRWYNEQGRPTDKIKIIKRTHDECYHPYNKVFDGEQAWCNAARYYSDSLHWSNQYHELPQHPPWDEDVVELTQREKQEMWRTR